MGKKQLCKKNCKYEYKEIDYLIENSKKKKRNMIFTTLEKKIQYKP